MHTNISSHLMNEIKARELAELCEMELEIMTAKLISSNV